MIIVPRLLLDYLKKKQLTHGKFAELIEVDTDEITALLNGEAVDESVARKFIYYFSAYKAQHYIDWGALGKENPLLEDSANAG